MSQEEKQELIDLQDMQIAPLSDDDIESVAGGGACSCCNVDETRSACTSADVVLG